MIPFVEKYRPKKLEEIRGQDKPISDLKELIRNYKQGRAIMLYGGHGTGKTSAVHALANEFDLEILEINSSDLRDKESMEKNVLNAVKQRSLFGRKKMILIDDIEGFSISDRGGVGVVSQVIEESSFPVVITVKDPWDRKINSIRTKSNLIGFRSINHVNIFNFLNEICLKENLIFEESILMDIAKKNEGDLRGAINDLQGYVTDIGIREKKIDIFNVIKKVLKNRDNNVEDVLNEMDINFDDYLLWLDENIAREYKKEELVKAYDRLSKADVFRGRILRQQYYRFLVYQMFLMSAGVSFSKKEAKPGFTSYQKPGRILKMFIAKQKYEKKKSIAEKIASRIHVSSKKVLGNFEDYYKLLNNKEIAKELELDDDEVKWLKR